MAGGLLVLSRRQSYQAQVFGVVVSWLSDFCVRAYCCAELNYYRRLVVTSSCIVMTTLEVAM